MKDMQSMGIWLELIVTGPRRAKENVYGNLKSEEERKSENSVAFVVRS